MEILNLYHFLYTLIKRIWLKFNCKKIGLVGSVSKWQLKSNKCAASHSLSYVCHRRRCRLLLASSLSLSLSPLCFGLLSADSTPFPHQLLSKAVQFKDNPSKPTILKSVLSLSPWIAGAASSSFHSATHTPLRRSALQVPLCELLSFCALAFACC